MCALARHVEGIGAQLEDHGVAEAHVEGDRREGDGRLAVAIFREDAEGESDVPHPA